MNTSEQMLMGKLGFNELVEADYKRNEAEHLWLVALQDLKRQIKAD